MTNATPSGADICSPNRSSKSSDPDYEAVHRHIYRHFRFSGPARQGKSAADIRQVLSIFRREAKPFDRRTAIGPKPTKNP